MRFNDAKIRSLKPKGNRYIEWEGGGFGVRVSPEGRKTFIYMYRFEGKPRMMSLGVYPTTSLALAHKAHADAVVKLTEHGLDPGTEKTEARKISREAPTVADLVDDFIEKYAKPRKKSWKSDERTLKREVVSRWGKKKAKDVKRRDVIAMLDEIEARDSGIMANRVLAVTRKMFNWAIGKDIVETSPCVQVKAPAKESAKDRFLDAAEVKTFWDNLSGADMFDTAKLALRLILVTGQRPGEVTGMQDDELDGDWWEIPASRAKNGLPHRVYLSALAKSVIEEAKTLRGQSDKDRIKNSPFVFVSPRKAQGYDPSSLPHFVRDNLEALELEAFTPHDLRRTAATHMHEIGISSEIVSKVLNHKDKGVTAVHYNRYQYDREKQQALETWARKLDGIINGTRDNVVSMVKV